MPDVLVVCTNCGKEHKVSEFASSETLVCSACQQPLSVPATQKQSKLSIRKTEEKQHLATDENGRSLAPEYAPLANQTRSEPKAMDRVHIARNKIKATRAIWSFVSFVVVGGVLIGLQYGMEERPEFLNYYMWSRLGIGGLVFLLVVMTAFEDNVFQGLFTLLLPPYAIYYAFVRTDSYLLRGASMALLASLGAELYFLGDNALVVVVQEAMNRFVQGGSDLIDAAANEPVF